MKTNHTSTIIGLICFLVCSSIAPLNLAAQAAAPIISTSWQQTTLEQPELMRAAERSLRAAGFTESFEIMFNAVYGVRGEYSAVIRPAAERGCVFFIVAGPDGKECTRLKDQMERKFSSQ